MKHEESARKARAANSRGAAEATRRQREKAPSETHNAEGLECGGSWGTPRHPDYTYGPPRATRHAGIKVSWQLGIKVSWHKIARHEATGGRRKPLPATGREARAKQEKRATCANATNSERTARNGRKTRPQEAAGGPKTSHPYQGQGLFWGDGAASARGPPGIPSPTAEGAHSGQALKTPQRLRGSWRERGGRPSRSARAKRKRPGNAGAAGPLCLVALGRTGRHAHGHTRAYSYCIGPPPNMQAANVEKSLRVIDTRALPARRWK